MNKKHLVLIVGATALVASFGAILVAGVIMYVISVESEEQENDHIESMNISEPQPGSIDSFNGSANAEVIDGNIVYTNAGSGSCPPVLNSATYDSETDTYVLTVQSYPNQACTMDLRGVKQIVSSTSGQDVKETSEIVIQK